MRKPDPRLCVLDTAIVPPQANITLRPALSRVWSHRINAKRFIFDSESSARVGEFMRDHLDLIIDNIEFARTPFPNCYFELDCLAMWRAWRPEQSVDATADERVGFLVNDGLVLLVAQGKRPDTGRDPNYPGNLVCGNSFAINRPQSVPLVKLIGADEAEADLVKCAYVFGGQRRLAPGDPRILRRGDNPSRHYVLKDSLNGHLGMGVSLPTIHSAWTYSQIAAHFDVGPAYNEMKPHEFAETCFLSGGDPLTLTTMLLLINQPSKYVSLDYKSREVGLWRGKRKVFQEHHVVRLHLDREVRVRDIFNLTDRKAPVAHGVMGHWKHFNKSTLCDHTHADGRQAWEPVGPERTLSGDYKRYWCPHCLQRRTWTEAFTTGGSGFATIEYAVTR